MREPVLLTTTDNPFNPFTQWVEWYARDVALGHHTCNLLGRINKAGDDYDDQEPEAAMAEIVRHNLSGKHIMVTERNFDALIVDSPPL